MREKYKDKNNKVMTKKKERKTEFFVHFCNKILNKVLFVLHVFYDLKLYNC